MEEVWKDIHITIASIPNTPIIPNHTLHHPTPTTSHRLRGLIFQDFLNNNNNNNTNNNDVEDTIFDNNNNNNNEDSLTLRSSIFEFLSPTHPSRSTTTTTTNTNTNNNNKNININNNTQEFQFLDNHQEVRKQGNSNSSFSGLLGMNNNAGYDALVSSSVLTTFGRGGCHGGDGCGGAVAFSNYRKRFSGSGGGGGVQDEDESVERRHKRMIKNRESAARSRARKQAYITELEMEVAQLSKENAMLRKQQRQLVESPPSQKLPRKYGLHRTSTAPF